MKLDEFVQHYSERGECQCGRCVDVGTTPDPTHPHTVDMVFLKVAPRNGPLPAAFITVTRAWQGIFTNVDPFDGAEHSYLELGGWIGDQGLALQYMGLGVALGVFQLLSPTTMLHLPSNDPLAQKMAGMGYLSVQAKR